MKKTESTGLNQLVDVRTITTEGKDIRLTATETERSALAKQFDIPAIHDLTVTGRLSQSDTVLWNGVIEADLEQTCVVTLEPFRRTYTYPFRIVFAKDVPTDQNMTDWDEDIVEPIEHGKINLGTAITDEFGSRLDPFPKKDDSFFEYRDPSDTDDTPDNPFAALKNLTPQK